MAEDAASGRGVPPRLDRDALADRLADASGLLLGLDFDGTLTPIAADPDEPELSPRNRRSLHRLSADPRVRVAVVSGRALSDLRSRVDVDGVVYAGNHGLELRRDGETVVHPDAVRTRQAIADLVETLSDRLGGVDGAVVEDKRVTATVHYRQVPDARVDGVRRTVRDAVAERAPDRIDVRGGKQVLELRPTASWDKGSVVRDLREDVERDWLTVYVGDDSTDEDAFAVLDDDASLGVHVGDDPETAADCRLPDPAAVEGGLAWLADEGVDHLG